MVYKEKNILVDKKKISAHARTWVSLPCTAKGVAIGYLFIVIIIRTMKIHEKKRAISIQREEFYEIG